MKPAFIRFIYLPVAAFNAFPLERAAGGDRAETVGPQRIPASPPVRCSGLAGRFQGGGVRLRLPIGRFTCKSQAESELDLFFKMVRVEYQNLKFDIVRKIIGLAFSENVTGTQIDATP
ncbi:hypothetical protein chiPu_0013114 [Chiloscyllium punctatum]|uniref:Uncharacterized protein n=1 Tax=Chiloscyllium punctatum TaxID=137246 RepID=A0A401SW59_CHIPU|nr:hypothetical protein [Chiloscyllium punctatum]